MTLGKSTGLVWCERVALTVTLLWLAALQATRLIAQPIGAVDDALLAAIAKNYANGFGYSSGYPELRVFDAVAAGVGPALLLPASAFISLLGNRYWVPGLTTIVLIWMLLPAIAFAVKRFAPEVQWRRFMVVTVVFLVLVTVARHDEWLVTRWYALFGEMPAALEIALGILLWCASARRPALAWGAGVVFGIAVQTKLFSVFAIAPALIWGCVRPLKDVLARDRISAGLWCTFGLAVPTAIVEIWKLATLGGLEPYRRSAERQTAWITDSSSGIGQLLAASSPLAYFKPRLIANAPILLDSLHGRMIAIAAVVATAALTWDLLRAWNERAISPSRAAAHMLTAGGVIHLAWWLAVSPTGWTNHLLSAVVYLAVAAALALTGAFANRTLVMVVATSVAIVLLPRARFISYVAPRFESQAALHDQLATREFVRSQQREGWRHVGCGWWVARDIDYLLPAGGNFDDCLLIAPQAFHDRNVALVRSARLWNWEHDARLDRFAAACEAETLFRRGRYVISHCRSGPDR